MKINAFHHPFQRVSIDPLGPVDDRAFAKSRKTFKAWPLVVRSLDTGAVMAILVDTMESKSIINALLRVQLMFGKIEKVSKNKGTNLMGINLLVDGCNGLLQLQEVTDDLVDSQYQNNV